MAEYIDKEKLLQKLSRMIDYCENDNKVSGLTALFQVGDAIVDCPTVDMVQVVQCGKGVLNEYMKQYRESVLRIVDEQPTADVISVVRCNDCKHLNPMEIGGYRKCLRDNLWKDTDDFCSRGERRKEDAKIH